MNKILRFGLLILGLQVGVWAQQSLAHTSKLELTKEVPTLALQTPDLGILAAEDILRDKQGVLYRIGVALPAHLTPDTEALVWRLNALGARAVGGAPPVLGADTDAVLGGWLGMSADEVARL